jgi:hypothetical protein
MIDSPLGKDGDLHGDPEFNISHDTIPSAVLTLAS